MPHFRSTSFQSSFQGLWLARLKKGSQWAGEYRFGSLPTQITTPQHINLISTEPKERRGLGTRLTQMEQCQQMLFHPGNVSMLTYLLDVTPSNLLPHSLSHTTQSTFVLFNFKNLVAKQHARSNYTIILFALMVKKCNHYDYDTEDSMYNNWIFLKMFTPLHHHQPYLSVLSTGHCYGRERPGNGSKGVTHIGEICAPC